MYHEQTGRLKAILSERQRELELRTNELAESRKHEHEALLNLNICVAEVRRPNRLAIALTVLIRSVQQSTRERLNRKLPRSTPNGQDEVNGIMIE